MSYPHPTSPSSNSTSPSSNTIPDWLELLELELELDILDSDDELDILDELLELDDDRELELE